MNFKISFALKNTLLFKCTCSVNKPQRENTITLPNAIDKYLDHLNASNCSTNTIYCYSRDFTCLLHYFGDILLKEITHELLDKFLIQIKKSSPKKSLSTINRINSAYRSFFKWCFMQEYIKKNLSEYILLKKSSTKNTIAIRQEEIGKLFNTICKFNDPTSQRDKALFALYAFSGIRKSEALALRVCDFDINSGIIFLSKTKRSGKRYQKIPSLLTKILDEYINKILVIEINENTQPLFPGQKQNSFLTSRQVSNRFEKWKKISGTREILTVHSFRVGYASLLYKNSKNSFLVSYALGHHSVNSIQHYISEEILNFKTILEKSFMFAEQIVNFK